MWYLNSPLQAPPTPPPSQQVSAKSLQYAYPKFTDVWNEHYIRVEYMWLSETVPENNYILLHFVNLMQSDGIKMQQWVSENSWNITAL